MWDINTDGLLCSFYPKTIITKTFACRRLRSGAEVPGRTSGRLRPGEVNGKRLPELEMRSFSIGV